MGLSSTMHSLVYYIYALQTLGMEQHELNLEQQKAILEQLKQSFWSKKNDHFEMENNYFLPAISLFFLTAQKTFEKKYTHT